MAGCATSRRAQRASCNPRSPVRSHPLARPRSSRSSSPPSIPTRSRACREGPRRSHRSCPPAPSARDRRCSAPSEKRLWSRPRRSRIGIGPIRPLPSTVPSSCRHAPRTPIRIRWAAGTPRRCAATAMPHRPARRSSPRMPPDAGHSARIRDRASPGHRVLSNRRPPRHDTNSPPGSPSHPRIDQLRDRHLVHAKGERRDERHFMHRTLRPPLSGAHPVRTRGYHRHLRALGAVAERQWAQQRSDRVGMAIPGRHRERGFLAGPFRVHVDAGPQQRPDRVGVALCGRRHERRCARRHERRCARRQVAFGAFRVRVGASFQQRPDRVGVASPGRRHHERG